MDYILHFDEQTRRTIRSRIAQEARSSRNFPDMYSPMTVVAYARGLLYFANGEMFEHTMDQVHRIHRQLIRRNYRHVRS